MRFENPFFTLELRRKRNRFSLFWTAALPGVVALLPVVIALPLLLAGNHPHWLPLVWTIAVTCLLSGAWFVGMIGGSSIFGAERIHETLDPLRLLPLSSVRWLLWKLQFPLLLVVLLPAAALTGTLLAAVLDIISVERGAETLAYLLAMGTYWVLGSVSLEGFDPSGSLQRKSGQATWRDIFHAQGVCGLFLPRALLGMTVPLLVFLPGQLNHHGNTRFFMGRVPLWWIIGVALLTVAAMAIVHAHQVLTDTARGEVVGRRIRWWGFGVEFFLFTGPIWWSSNYRFLALVFLLVPLLTLVSPSTNTSAPKTTSNPRLEAELDWLAKRYPNPAFLCNLRFGLGNGSLRRRALHSLFWLLPLAALLCGSYFLGPYSAMGPVRLLLFLCGTLFSIPVTCLCGATSSRTARWWLDERFASQLTLIPLTSQEWVVGQIAASLLINLSRYWNVIFLMAACMVWAGAVTHWGYFVPGLCTMAALLLLAPVCLGYPEQLASSPAIRPIMRTTVTKVLPLTLGFGSLLAAGFVLGSVANGMPWAGWLGALLSLIGMALAILLFQTRLQQWAEALELVRRGEATWQQFQTVRK